LCIFCHLYLSLLVITVKTITILKDNKSIKNAHIRFVFVEISNKNRKK
jgi:hypothetical protein